MTAVEIDGARLRRYREDRGLTLTALATAAGISKAYLSMLETGERSQSSPPVAARLAGALDIAIGDLRPIRRRRR